MDLPLQVEPPEDIEVPDALLSEEEVTSLVASRRPRFVPLPHSPPGTSALRPPDADTGLCQIFVSFS